jgi:hypothetical protein
MKDLRGTREYKVPYTAGSAKEDIGASALPRWAQPPFICKHQGISKGPSPALPFYVPQASFSHLRRGSAVPNQSILRRESSEEHDFPDVAFRSILVWEAVEPKRCPVAL